MGLFWGAPQGKREQGSSDCLNGAAEVVQTGTMNLKTDFVC